VTLHKESDVLSARYELGPVIGRGATGTVRHGHDRRLGRDVAIKSLYPHLAIDPDARDRFLREAQLAARLQHPHAVAIHDVGGDDTPFIVMEHLSGGTLADRLRRGPMASDDAIALGCELLSALEAAHMHGIIHRDIKPANIMFTGDGSAKLVDFGIATSAEHANHTTTGVVLGTLAYVAPERLAGSRATASSDLYAVGVVLFEAVTGHPPFAADNPAAMLQEITATVDAPDIAGTHPEIDHTLASTLARALHPDPTRRFASADEMMGALRARPSTGTVAAPTDASRSRRTEWTWIAAVAAVLILLAGLAAIARDRDGSPPPRTAVDAEAETYPELDQAIDALEDAVRAP
jgi:serine/threonine protein kinase